MKIVPRDYQSEATASVFKYFSTHPEGNPIVAMPTGCHAKGHNILMYNGSLKKVEDIVIGDLLMGPDSLSRTVLNLARGRQGMRRITPNNGESFVVNLDHKILTHVTKQGGKSNLRQQRSEVITIRDYEEGGAWFQHLRKLQRRHVDFETALQNIEPYILGLLLGDGSTVNGTVSLTTIDKEIKNEFINFTEQWGCHCRDDRTKTGVHQLHVVDPKANRSTPNKVTHQLRILDVMEKRSWEKSIPVSYLIANRTQRLELLAGLIDTDGSYTRYNYFEYCTTSVLLAYDIAFLSRSLGFRASILSNKKGKHRQAYRINISGDINLIPTRLPRKQAKASAKQKNCLVTGFKVEVLPEDNFYGFTLSGDHLYLDGEFIVHHNTGKSVVIADFLEQVFRYYPSQKIMVLTHVKELIEQNYEKLLAVWPEAPAGIYSAGLKRRDVYNSIIFGGIGSVGKKAELFGKVDLILIDEAHLVSPNDKTMYQKFIATLMERNPYLRIIGLTATPWRLGQGHITEDGLFTDLCFDITGLDAFNRLIAEGYLCTLIPKKTTLMLDVDGVHMRGGEFIQKELQTAVNKDEVTEAALKEVLEVAGDRLCWLIFTAGVEHAIDVSQMLNDLGVPCGVVHGGNKKHKMSSKQRAETIADFKSGKLRALANNNVLTTGFDHPPIDLIIMLRPTASPGLWVQMLGRGTRPFYAPGFNLSTADGRLLAIENSPKRDCLVMDFGGNTKRMGPINDPCIPNRKGKSKGDAPVKLCDKIDGGCDTYIHASLKFCPHCNKEFFFETKLNLSSSTDQLIKADLPVMEEFKVDHITYMPHTKAGAKPMIKVAYYCGLRMFNEYVCVEHEAFAGRKAKKWWNERASTPIPDTTEQALKIISGVKSATSLRVWVNKKYPEIMAYCYDGTHFDKEEPDVLATPTSESVSKSGKSYEEDDIPF